MDIKFIFIAVSTTIIACNPNIKGIECSETSITPCVTSEIDTNVNVINNTSNVVTNTTTTTSVELTNENQNNDAGSTTSVDSGIANDAGTVNPTPRICNTASADSSDKRNWYTTNHWNTEFASEWFQLTTFDGFSEDGCTYTGQIKWFYKGTDGYWESDRVNDEPSAVFIFKFEADGTTKLELSSNSTTVYQTNVFYQGQCYEPNEIGSLKYDINYLFHHCLWLTGGNHPLKMLNVFAGSWDDVLNIPSPRQIIIMPSVG